MSAPQYLKLLALIAFATLLISCGKKEAKTPPQPPATIISTTAATETTLDIVEQTIGSMESLIDPGMGAEVPGKVLKMLVHAGQDVRKGQLIAILDDTDYQLQKREAEAEISRLEALLSNQGRVVDRNRQLVTKNFISQNALEDSLTQQNALQSELEGAKARLATIEHNSSKTRVYSPIDGRVEKQVASPGDFVKQGDSLFQLIGTQKLRAHLPFPESVAPKLHPGQTVRLSTPTAPDKPYVTTIKEIKPLVGANRAVDAIADVVNQPGWQGGASVNGTVVLGKRPKAVVVPEASVILRPAGEVVYVIQGDSAAQRTVKIGLRQDGLVEITEGLKAGETVAVDGAAYLTDKAKVKAQPAVGAGK
jgi:RND family efflux transporter MFP subunit